MTERMLAWTITISFVGALVALLTPKRSAGAARGVALATALCGFAIAFSAFLRGSAELHTVTQAAWVPSLGITYHLAADGITLCLVLLTAVVSIAGVLFSWNVEHRANEFFAFYLLLIGAVYGVFLSYDVFCSSFSMRS